MKIEQTEDGVYVLLHLSDNSPSEEAMLDDKPVIWKDVLVAGEYPMTPTTAGAVERKLTVIAEGESSHKDNTIAMSDLLFAHDDGAFKYVTIPTKHRDEALDNTGYVPRPKGLRVRKRNDGTEVLQAALGFTEPDVKGKVQRGTIPDVSAGIFFNWLNKHSKKKYRAAMKHVALTPNPFMGNLDPFPAVFASDDEADKMPEGTKIEFYSFDDTAGDNTDAGGTSDSTKSGEVVWNETMGFNWVMSKLNDHLNPRPSSDGEGDAVPVARPYYSVMDASSEIALVNEYYKGDSTRFLIPFKRTDDDVEPAPSIRWVEVKEAMIAASDDVIKDFEDKSPTKILDKLRTLLADQSSGALRPEALSFDGKVRVRSTTSGQAWLVPFEVNADGEVFLGAGWESIQAPAKADAKRPAPVPSPRSRRVMLADTVSEITSEPDEKIRAAIQRRKLLSGASSSH